MHREVQALLPYLKLVIVAGRPLVQRLFDDDVEPGQIRYGTWRAGGTIRCAMVDFPKTGAEPEFQELLRLLRLELGLSEIDDGPVSAGVVDPGEDRFREYVRFELHALSTWWEQIRAMVA
ncbi:MAG: hypothetical protein HPY55_13960 [Firmicutes bacterium]|nr:hypothetical protein [Bacillota bacterium]